MAAYSRTPRRKRDPPAAVRSISPSRSTRATVREPFISSLCRETSEIMPTSVASCPLIATNLPTVGRRGVLASTELAISLISRATRSISARAWAFASFILATSGSVR
jgi:hypothetical protein